MPHIQRYNISNVKKIKCDIFIF